MDTCEQALELISARLDGVLTPEEASVLEAHLARCPECRALADDLAAMHSAMPGLYREPPAQLKEGVMAQIRAECGPVSLEAERKKRAGRRQWRSWGAMAAVMAVVLMGAVSMRFGGDAPGTAGVPEPSAPVQSAELYTMQPGPSEQAAVDIPVNRGLTSDRSADGESGGSSDLESQPPQVTGASGNGDSQTGGGDKGESEIVPDGQEIQPTADAIAVTAGENTGTASVEPFQVTPGEAAPEPTQDAEVYAAGAVTAAGRLYTELLAADWPTGEQAEGEDLTGYRLTSGDGARTAVLRYLKDSENGKYSIFKLYETGGSEDSTLNFYAVPLDGESPILTAWADGVPGDDSAFWRAMSE